MKKEMGPFQNGSFQNGCADYSHERKIPLFKMMGVGHEPFRLWEEWICPRMKNVFWNNNYVILKSPWRKKQPNDSSVPLN